MAQQIINNGESGLLVRTKLNSNFTELYARSEAPGYDLSSVATFDGETDITATLNAAFADPAIPAYFIPAGLRGVISDTVILPPGKSLDMRGALLLYTGPKDRRALQIGTPGLPFTLTTFIVDGSAPAGYQWDKVTGTQYLRGLAVANVAIGTAAPDVYQTSDFADGDFVGIEMFNIRALTDISVYRTGGFYHGLRCTSDSFYGFAYNTIELGFMWANRIGVTLFTNGATPDDGFVTENRFIGGTFRGGSDYPAAESMYGVVFAWNNVNSYRGHNGNLFLHPCFELGASSGERVPVYYQGCGNANRVEFARWETGNGPFMLCDGQALNPAVATFVRDNYALINDNALGVGEAPEFVIQTNGAVGNKGVSANSSSFSSPFMLPDIQNSVKAHTNGEIYLTGPWLGLTSVAPTPRKNLAANGRLARDYFEITSDVTFIGTMLDVSSEKEFTVRPICEGELTGRLVMLCYDAHGVQMVSGSDGRDLLGGVDWPGNRAGGFPWVPSVAGGCFYAAIDSLANRTATICVTAAVKSVFIGLTAGTATCRIKNLQIMSVPSRRPPGQRGVVLSYPLPATDMSYSTADPDTLTGTYGIYERGEEVGNYTPASGQPGSWRCSTAGRLAPAWTATTVEVVGSTKANGANVYLCTVAGTTAGSGGPSGTGTAIVDGTVTWRYLAPRAVFLPGPSLP